MHSALFIPHFTFRIPYFRILPIPVQEVFAIVRRLRNIWFAHVSRSRLFTVKQVAMAETSPAKGFVAGGFGGVCLVLTGHPLDTMKVSDLVLYAAIIIRRLYFPSPRDGK